MAELQQARAAKAWLRSELRGHDGVGGIGLTGSAPDGYRVRVNLTKASAETRVPSSVDGVAVDVRLTGPVTAQV